MNNRSIFMNFRVTKHEREAIDRLCDLERRTASAVMRMLLYEGLRHRNLVVFPDPESPKQRRNYKLKIGDSDFRGSINERGQE